MRMTLQRRPSPFGELVSLRQAMDRLFDDNYLRPYSGWNGEAGLALDIRTTKDALLVEAALPGVKPEDVDITVENGQLTIRGEANAERREGEGEYLVREISRGTFVRTLTLPNGLEADKAEASFENGVLTLRIPKAEQLKPRQIRINPVSGGKATTIDTNTGSTGSMSSGGSTGSTSAGQSQPATTGAGTSERGA